MKIALFCYIDADSWVERTKCVSVYMVPQICRKPFLRHDSLESAQQFPKVLIASQSGWSY